MLNLNGCLQKHVSHTLRYNLMFEMIELLYDYVFVLMIDLDLCNDYGCVSRHQLVMTSFV